MSDFEARARAAAPRVATGVGSISPPREVSAVAWGAVVAGAAAMAALSLVLLILGTGLGLSSVSPWSQSGISAIAFGWSTILWLTLTQVVASGMGGYLTGRLRSRWFATAQDEVYFRDTAHGFLAWSVATLATAVMLASAIGSIVSGGVQAGAAVTGSNAAGSDGAALGSYLLDSLYRRDRSVGASAVVGSTGSSSAATASPVGSDARTAEIARIFAAAMRTPAMPAPDVKYVGQIVAERTGLSQPEAEKRVTDTLAQSQAAVREAQLAATLAADKARKASAYAALWLFVSLLGGAFTASLAATFGGRTRDQ